MKKLLVIGTMVLGAMQATAQNVAQTSAQDLQPSAAQQTVQVADNDGNSLLPNVFNHLGVGVGIGVMNGLSVELATPATRFLALRAGYNFLPKLKMDVDFDTDFGDMNSAVKNNPRFQNYQVPDEITVEGKLDLGTAHVLVDVYPFQLSSFRVTLGAYFGADKIIKVYNKNEGDLMGVTKWNQDSQDPTKLADLRAMNGGKLDKIGFDMGDYFLEPDAKGNLEASIKVKNFRPYVGVGFGRAVPRHSRVTCNFDLGVQFWGSPEVYLHGANGDEQLQSSDLSGEGSKAVEILSKVKVCPMMSLRIVGRIF